MDKPQDSFRTVVVCDDIRDEIGNKKSLMGVFSGDIIVAEFPAYIQIAIYLEVLVSEDDKPTDIELSMKIDDSHIFGAKVTVSKQSSPWASIMLPKGVITFEKESSLSLTGKIITENEIELFRKKIIRGAIQPR